MKIIFCVLAVLYSAGLLVHGKKIVGGVPAELGEFPSQLSLHLNDSMYGAANVLSEKYVLTAAHCVMGLSPAELSVRSGSLYFDQGQRHQVTRIIMHEQFNFTDSLIHDIAIVEVDPPFTFGPNVQPLALPNQGENPAAGAPATAIGWGRLWYNGPTPDTMNKVTIEIRDQAVCEELYANFIWHIYEGHLCADVPEGGLGTCSGDSGGPLFVDGVAVGIASWANECALQGYPSVFTRLPDYRDWITQNSGV